MTRLALSTVVLAALLAAGAVTAVATSGIDSGQAAVAGSPMGTVGVKLNVSKFVKSGTRLIAKGTAVATYTPQSGRPTVVTHPFSARVTVPRLARRGMQAQQPAVCPVLTLQLDQLALDLLGLHVDLSKVILTITANPDGGILGKLFCNLADGKTSLATTGTARTLSAAAQRSGFSTKGIGFGVPTRQGRTAAPGPCSIVDLVLGPLHLELLGLIVDLNQIHLQITADPNGGILGSLLCSIAPPPTTTLVPTP